MSWRWVKRGVAALAALWFGLFAVQFALTAIGHFTEEWVSYCEGPDLWSQHFTNGQQCFDEANKHLDATGHGAGCKRSDWPIVWSQKIFDTIMLLAPGSTNK